MESGHNSVSGDDFKIMGGGEEDLGTSMWKENG